MKTIASRDFNQDVSRAKRIALEEPLFVTDRGKPTHVLLSVDAYRQLSGKAETMAELLQPSERIAVDPDWRSLGPWGRGS